MEGGHTLSKHWLFGTIGTYFFATFESRRQRCSRIQLDLEAEWLFLHLKAWSGYKKDLITKASKLIIQCVADALRLII